jgi:predicted RNA-binding protein with PUA-like domain
MGLSSLLVVVKTSTMPRYWLMKSEPGVFSIDDLSRAKDATTRWDGVRNFQARYFLRSDIAVGDGVLFYHSSADPPAVAGTARVVRAGYPDPTQFDPRDSHFDRDSSRDDPRWYAVDIQFETKFAREVTLPELRSAKPLAEMVLLRRGSRLSVQPVTAGEWKQILKMGSRA